MDNHNTESVTNIDLGNLCSKTAYGWAEKTFKNVDKYRGLPKANLRGSFASILSFNSMNLAIASDGIGTKIEVAERMKNYGTLGFDLVAMIVDDLVCVGARPTTLSNILDVDSLDHAVVDQLMQGLVTAANNAGIAVTGGEIAELGKRIDGYGDGMHFNWCATGLGVVEVEEQIIDGTKISENDIVISLQSPGFRSNGFSLARSILINQYGDDWHNKPCHLNQSWGEVLLTPSLIYSPLITTLLVDGIIPRGIAHVTGGGIAENLARVLKKQELGAVLNDLFKPDPSMCMLQSFDNLAEDVAYRHWNMGNGMLLIVSEAEADRVLKRIAHTKYTAKKAGVITKEKVVELHTLGAKSDILRYELCQL